jgi:hypothetical protein
MDGNRKLKDGLVPSFFIGLFSVDFSNRAYRKGMEF